MEECGEFDWDAVDADSSSAEIMQRSRQTNPFNLDRTTDSPPSVLLLCPTSNFVHEIKYD